MSQWKIQVLKTPEQQAAGVKQFPSPLPRDYLLFFPWVTQGGVVTMEGIGEPLRLYTFDENLSFGMLFSLNPGEKFILEPSVKHIAETSANAPVVSFSDRRELAAQL